MTDPTHREGYAPFGDCQTWYRVTGDLHSGKVPLVALHGGPGCTHDYIDSLTDLAATGRAVVHYDQIGNGRSTHRPEAPAGFWTVDLFLAELDALLAHLGIAGRYALLGQSWGGMLGAEHAVRQPKGLHGLVIANSPSSMATWVEGCNALRRDLPAEAARALDAGDATGDYRNPAYLDASRLFYERHVCRALPWPDEVTRTFDWIDRDPTVYHTMNGPSEFRVIGSLRDWSVVDRLPQVQAPTLVISGRHDEAQPITVRPFAERIPGAEWVIFENSSHMPHVEERALYMQTVARFLDRLE
ncbi:proline iminopeptidase-family hydrolase [Xinfangfangia pollutisoli]|uniref:proline iminopeptidase-family hydrolase n=1 Tax=Xinfangfangia pollutisoli TaxID=2865960 RepID=UPI001CD34809|nr:proline iminopeptidase-family hydrolase [Xinfangfangia pollutisoli]